MAEEPGLVGPRRAAEPHQTLGPHRPHPVILFEYKNAPDKSAFGDLLILLLPKVCVPT